MINKPTRFTSTLATITDLFLQTVQKTLLIVPYLPQP